MAGIADRQCQREVVLLATDDIDALLKSVPGWQYSVDTNSISRRFSFNDYRQTMQFVNEVAAIADKQDHHPDLLVTYNRCTVSWTTHSVGGLSENDFICAARVNQLAAEN